MANCGNLSLLLLALVACCRTWRIQATTLEVLGEFAFVNSEDLLDAVPGTFAQSTLRAAELPKIRGVQYAPHQVGEPRGNVVSTAPDLYQSIYREQHRKHLGLIRTHLGANTLRLQPWNNEVTKQVVTGQQLREPFYQAMKAAGIQNLIPTFQVSRHFYSAMEMKQDVDNGPDSPMFHDFASFISSISDFEQTFDDNDPDRPSFRGWSIDLALKMEDLWGAFPPDGKVPDCDSVAPPSMIGSSPSPFQLYKNALTALGNRVWPEGRQPSWIQDKPLLVPLDLTDVVGKSWQRARGVLECLSSNWLENTYKGLFSDNRAQWLLAFTLPMPSMAEDIERNITDCSKSTRCKDFVSNGFLKYIDDLTVPTPAQVSKKAKPPKMVFMLGAHALAYNTRLEYGGIVEDYGIDNQYLPRQQLMLRYAFQQYLQREKENPNLEGLILDEWMDNWDRGDAGPFILATTKALGTCGSRFKQDRGPECRRVLSLHDDGSTYYAYPENVGLAATLSKVVFNCAKPRFGHLETVKLFSEDAATDVSGATEFMVCGVIVPDLTWACIFGGILAITLTLICCSKACQPRVVQERTTASSNQVQQAWPRHTTMPDSQTMVAECYVGSTVQGLQGDFKICMSSKHFSTQECASRWLKCHYDTQVEILEKQLTAECRAVQACRARALAVHGQRGQAPNSELAAAVRTLHMRCFEGFDAWCKHVGVRRLDPERARPVEELFAECVLQRTVESLSEHVVNCPERISFLLHGIIKDAERQNGIDVEQPQHLTNLAASRVYKVDLDVLHDGLARMMQNSNPYKRSNVASLIPGVGPKYNELGLNFDDINESGIQCARHVKKTFKEPRSVFVLVDLVLSYRVTIIIKYWVVVLAFYLYLGSGRGRDITTKYNGALIKPQYLRLDMWFYAGILDGAVWTLLELLVFFYSGGQRWPSWRTRSPGSPNFGWLFQHGMCLLLSVAGVWLLTATLREDVTQMKGFGQRSDQCLNSCTGDCMDPRVKNSSGNYDFAMLFSVLQVPLGYWLHRFVVFFWLHRRRWPTFIYGRPDPKLVNTKDGKVFSIWAVMLACCVFVEGYWMLPVTAGLDWMNACGLDTLSILTGVHSRQVGVCTQYWVTSSCAACLLSVTFVWCLVLVICYLDIYFVFYVFAALVGGLEGSRRKLNNLKNPSFVIDLRQAEGGSPQARKGTDLELMEKAFGPRWQDMWRMIVKDLWEDSLIGKAQVGALLESAGVRFRGIEDLNGELELSGYGRELDLAGALYGCTLAAERLSFFFKSLSGIVRNDRGWMGRLHVDEFRPEFDGLTADQLHVGSIPPVSMIIPAYDEVVTPTRKTLCEGNRTDDARNQIARGGDRTMPPKGDGMNTNLAFMISQFKEEWHYLAERLNNRDPNGLYASFVGLGGQMPDDHPECQEICKWAALRTQSVAKTVLGALKYLRALALLPAIKDYYAQHLPQHRRPEMHGEVLLAHQTFGSKRGNADNDKSVKRLLKENSDLPFYLVFDLNEQTSDETKALAGSFVAKKFGCNEDEALQVLQYARVKCCWSEEEDSIKVVEVLPRRFPLRVGHHDDFKSQGKASNQLNALLFASGHCCQALDCNMGTFMGECCKVPFVLRDFLPADAQWEPNRTNVQCRYIGFREYIFTGREGCVGQRHAAAEWTFGTIYQRFLSVLEIRMHYGHPDFLDGFWARNRGGMSKCSPVVNLSEDIFAGYNVRMREEKSPHTDVLEFEKGREATFNAASNFFSKIAGGSISVLRSRDNHLLCERIGILHGMSFYFASIAFYLSNLLVDLTTYLYVITFVCFTLASISLGDLKQLDSALGTEWILSMGLFTMIPQLVEMIIEFGAPTAIGKIIVSLIPATLFFIFQNKNVASSMKQGIVTGAAKYLFTGRPPANRHQTWKDIYTTYWKSHYHPGLDLLMLYLIYCLLTAQSEEGQLPMSLVIACFATWLCGPLFFSPFPKWKLIKQDLEDFKTFINSKAGMEVQSTEEVLERASKHKCRSLYELGVADEICKWTERPLKVNMLFIAGRIVVMGVLLTTVPAGILDFALPFVAVLGVQWFCILFFFRGGNNNIFMLLTIVVWVCVPFLSPCLIGDRARIEHWRTRLPEYVISTLVFFTGLGLMKRICILTAAGWKDVRIVCFGVSELEAEHGLKLAVRSCYFYFFDHHTRLLRAYLILVVNFVLSLILMLLDLHCIGIGLHTWMLLNGSAAQAEHKNGFMEGENRLSFIQDRPNSFGFGSFRRLSRMRVAWGAPQPVNPQDAELDNSSTRSSMELTHGAGTGSASAASVATNAHATSAEPQSFKGGVSAMD